jgi:hypothetical protein
MEKALGPEAKLKAEMVNGKIKLTVEYDGHQVDGGAYILADADMLVDAIMKIIPGESAFEQAAAMVIKTALKSVKL